MTIHWFPGHMAKARRLLEENLGLVDAVIELRDARMPLASANPLLSAIMGDKVRLIALTKPDLAAEVATERFVAYFAHLGTPAIKVNARDGRGTKELLKEVKAKVTPKLPRDKAGGQALRGVRVMVAGIPNVGKSSLINSLSGRAAARTGALPGLTQAKQWINLPDGTQVLDTPGLLWPRLDDPAVAFKLAVTGAISSAGFDVLDLAGSLAAFAVEMYPEAFKRHFRLEGTMPSAGHELLELLGRKRGCLIGGGKVDLNRIADILLREFREGKIGRFTLDQVPDHA
ncbi:MAG: ribosome biogenesis GTPase YlqF [Firmicutes bacterium]|nr:ribosome biogenesis GTPase YlqF [Dethiobacter sp.]MBS3888611.1 ribosome biogenesis GTPase YlqF [Bacillota bacterium]MBS4053803.1 ribosome biogenesis GTPase YlqF [Thermaerobacter sp.]